MSLAAVPVFLIGRRLQLSERLSLACALLAVVTPNLFYASYVLGEPIAYPLVLGALYFGIRAISQPTRGRRSGSSRAAGLPRSRGCSSSSCRWCSCSPRRSPTSAW